MSKLYLVPISVCVILQGASIICYIAAILQDHVPVMVPYISDAGSYHPESCIFGQLMNIGALLMGFTIYIRYRQVLSLYDNYPQLGEPLLKRNKLSIWFGMIASAGISIAGNFELAFVPIVHHIGAFLCFIFAIAYFWTQTCLSYMLHPMYGTKFRAHLRLAMSISCTILCTELMVTGTIAWYQFTGENMRKWQPSDGGYLLHVISSLSEWIMCAIFYLYILTFTDEFRDVIMDPPPVTVVLHQNNVK